MPTSAPHFVEVYLAANPMQAHLLRILLEQDGIPARVVGDLLQSVAGEIPFGAASAPAVWVSEDDNARAREIIEQWEATQRSRTDEEPQTSDCPKCGASFISSDIVCPACGSALDDDTDDAADPALGTSETEPNWTPLVTNWRAVGAAVVFALILAAALVWWFLAAAAL